MSYNLEKLGMWNVSEQGTTWFWMVSDKNTVRITLDGQDNGNIIYIYVMVIKQQYFIIR